jgi:Transposase and inactivated derivatives
VLPTVNSEAMACHLQAISAAVPEGRHAGVVVDGAGWHTQAALEGLSNVSLLSLPPASPELNPVEQVWQWLRQHTLANRCFEHYEAILEACCEACNAFTSTVGAVKRLCSRQWAILEP